MSKPLTELQRRILDKYEPDSHDVSIAIVAVLDRLDFLEDLTDTLKAQRDAAYGNALALKIELSDAHNGWRRTMAEASAETTDATRLLDEAVTLAADRLKVINRLSEDLTLVVADRSFALKELNRLKPTTT